jgi:hypothetical protein
MKLKRKEMAQMKRNRVGAEQYPNSQISQEGITMTGRKQGRTRNMAFRMLAVGLASLLVLVLAGPVSTVLGGPSHSSNGQPGHNGGVHFPVPFIIGITALALGDVKDCQSGAVIPPEKLTAEFFFADGAHPPFQFNQLEKIIIKAEGYQPKEITQFMTMQVTLGFIKLIFIVPLEQNICLQAAPIPLPKLPDYVAQWSLNRVFEDYTIDLEVTVTNRGEGDAASFSSVGFSADGRANLRMAPRTPPLRAGASALASYQKLQLGPCAHVLRAEADAWKEVSETDETNNFAVIDPLVLSPQLRIEFNQAKDLQFNRETGGFNGSFRIVNEGNWPGKAIAKVTLLGPDGKQRNGNLPVGTGVIMPGQEKGPYRFWVLGPNSYFPTTPEFRGVWTVTIELESLECGGIADQLVFQVTVP